MPKFRGELDLEIDSPTLEHAEAVAETAATMVTVTPGLRATVAVVVEVKEGNDGTL